MAVAQDVVTGQVLMVAHMNRAAFDKMVATGRGVYFCRVRQRLWRKGEESGYVQHVKNVLVDCDGDAVLLVVEQTGGAACYEGYPSCFYRELGAEGPPIIAQRVFESGEVYGKESVS